ncbi:uncharacterized protein L201_005469 [Kwoniella dendrophila CBS 6074]|uniref:Uncharacterized protein n=1 Tax=Kwoniella dendrophila CBS 6074 TaxID=1295534 RepID=A0AAX4K093_9TREE
MTHSSLFSPNNHVRHSHYLQPETNLAPSHPPTSFGKSSGFLKKIPSVLFNKEKTPIKKKSSKAHLQIHIDSSSPKPMKSTITSNTIQASSSYNTSGNAIGEKDKKTKKPRKALADLFGWGNHHHSNQNQPQQQQQQQITPVLEKASPVPVVPPKDNPAMLKKLNRPPSTKSNNSHFSTLHTPVIAPRPSIGDDPFVRDGQGAEVVDHVFRHSAETPSAKSIALDRRASISSSKAMSYKTGSSDVNNTKEISERMLPTMAKTNVEQRRVSAPLTQHVHTDLPPRSASLGKLLGTTMAAPLPQVVESPIEAEEQPIRTLKKEKTKSRVWGLLGRNKSKKEKVKVPSESTVPALPPKDPWTQTMAAPPTGTLSLTAHIDDKYAAAATMRSNRSATRPRPPFLHISAPSLDDPSQVMPATASTTSFPHTANRSTFEDHDISPNGSPSRYPINSGRGGVWESVVGTGATRISDDAPVHAIEALMGPSRLPKRKSLTGLFGVTIKKSFDRIKPSSPKSRSASHQRIGSSPPRIAANPTLRPLSEEIEEASGPFKTATVPSAKFTSRFAILVQVDEKSKEIPARDPSLRRVASATDKLFNLVSCLDFSPASNNSPALRRMGSNASLEQAAAGSPTPIRRVRSAMLSNKASGSSLKPPSTNVSPLKLALHREQVAANQTQKVSPVSPSPPRESLVRKGMRNIFSPPSPAPPKHGKPSKPDMDLMSGKVIDERVGMGQTMGPQIIEERTQSIKGGSLASDVPADLKALINETSDILKAAPSLNQTYTLGLPAPPPKDRVPARRPGPSPPALSLPPVPDMPAPAQEKALPVCKCDLDPTETHDCRDSVIEDMLTTENTERRNSFDFTNEYAALDQVNQRASFVEALKSVSSIQSFLPASLPPLPVLPESLSARQPLPEFIPSFHISKPSDSTSIHDDSDYDDEDDGGEFADNETMEETAIIGHVTGIAKTSPVRRESLQPSTSPTRREHAKPINSPSRKEPFRGQFAFQQHVATMPRQESHASFGAPEPVLTVPDIAPTSKTRRGHHKRGESGFSIATMSSIGSVIGTDNDREYTNHFEVNFNNNINSHSRHQSITETIEEVSDENSPKPRKITSQESFSSMINNAGARPTTRRGHHHRRNSSIVSVDSLSEIVGGGQNLFNGPPNSRLNGRRPSYGYISRHRRNGSGESTFGRPDWAAHHRRNSSSISISSVSQIARPGLGDRMFQLDNAVQLTSITGSPPDIEPSTSRPQHQRQISWDSLFDGTQDKINDSLFDDSLQHQSRDSIFDSDRSFNRSSIDGDSLFGPEHSSAKKHFFLKGLRPISTVSTATNNSQGDDTFQHVHNYMQNVVTPVKAMARELEACLQAEGENMSNMTPLGKVKMRTAVGRQMLGSSMSRPQRPGRRRPAHLVLAEPPLDTPGLTSPSASETSSRLSLDTNAASITLGQRIRPSGAGHYRQKSSAGVKIEATIHEMPSMATLRAKNSSASPKSREPTIVGVDDLGEEDEYDRMRSIRNWVEWEREAVDEFRKTKNCWRDSEESKHAIEDWKMPTTNEEIAAFLAQSTQAYKPLNIDKLPNGKIAHRRKSSLSNSRALSSPYGLPLPKPSVPINVNNKSKKMSLTTKYEQKKNSTSSTISASSAFAFAFPFPDDVPEAPSEPPAPIASIFSSFLGGDEIGNTRSASSPPSSQPTKNADSLNLHCAEAKSVASDHFGIKKLLETNDDKDKSNKEIDQKRNRVTSTARRQALGWGRKRNSDGPEKVIGLGYSKHEVANGIPPMPNSAIPLQTKNTNIFGSKANQEEKGKENQKPIKKRNINNNNKANNIFNNENSSTTMNSNIIINRSSSKTKIVVKKNIFTPINDQENSLISQNSKLMTTKTKSPIKKKSLRQAVSQPRNLRV